jgi:phage shock protein PspC (stress-responsive transcriptional regulator)
MTTERQTVQRRLYRRSRERVIAGVASGLGDYFNIDPLLIRIALVASLVFGGLGIFLYAAAWLLVPDESSDTSIVERLLGRRGMLGGLFGVLLVVIGAAILIGVLGDVGTRSDGVFGLGIAILVIIVGAMLLRQEPRGHVAEARAEVTGAAETAAVASEPAQPVVHRPPRPRSPLGWYVMGGALVTVGLLAIASNVTGAQVDLGQYFGLALGVIGIGLVVGAWWGHARWLIVLGVLLLPFAWAASLIQVPLEGGWGSYRFNPAAVEDVRDEYRLTGGELVLDLTRLDAGSRPMTIAASVAMGELVVVLPDNAGAQIDTSVGGGTLRVLGAFEDGTRLQDQRVIDGDGPQFNLDLDAGLGVVRVETRQAEGR